MPHTRTVRIDGDALADLRARQGLSIVKLAKAIGRHRQSVNKLETGRTTHASTAFAYQLARALGVEVAAFTLPEPGEDGAQPDEETAAA